MLNSLGIKNGSIFIILIREISDLIPVKLQKLLPSKDSFNRRLCMFGGILGRRCTESSSQMVGSVYVDFYVQQLWRASELNCICLALINQRCNIPTAWQCSSTHCQLWPSAYLWSWKCYLTLFTVQTLHNQIPPHTHTSPRFLAMTYFLHGWRFNNVDEVENGGKEFKLAKWHKKGIELLATNNEMRCNIFW